MESSQRAWSLVFGLAAFFSMGEGVTQTTIDYYREYEPQQIHISTGSSHEMIIVWNTNKDTNDSRVSFGKKEDGLNLEAIGSRSELADGGAEKRRQWVHQAILKDLDSHTVYYYKVGSTDYPFSKTFSFKTWPAGDDWSPRVIVYGDLGAVNGLSIPTLKHDISAREYHAIFHIGDIAYNLNENNGRVGDDFMRQIEPLASTVPYLTCPGNHESDQNFLHYKKRFHMPGDIDERMYYSFKMGPVRFISTNTEYIFFPEYDGLILAPQHYAWMEEELKDANLPENRWKQPWIITLGHRPMYCSNKNTDDCTRLGSLVRKGILNVLGWEDLFNKYGVDVAIWAHEHSYERLWPVYNQKVKNGSLEHPYTNPKAPIHIVTGSAGTVNRDVFDQRDREEWSAFQSLDYGYSRLNVFNSTHLQIQYVSADKNGSVIDDVMVVKQTHGPFQNEGKSWTKSLSESLDNGIKDLWEFIQIKLGQN